MIAPDPERHSIARIGEVQFAVWFLFARDSRVYAFDLDMHARLNHRAILRMPIEGSPRNMLRVSSLNFKNITPLPSWCRFLKQVAAPLTPGS